MIAEDASRVVESCRVCGSRLLHTALDLGMTPLANAFVPPERRHQRQDRFPLVLLQCEVCGLAQLSVVVRPEVLFSNYHYSSSASSPMVEHFDELAAEMIARFGGPDSFIVEVGSNDGVLLGPLVRRGARVLGVEPAANLARVANERGLETLPAFFSSAVARRIALEHGPANVIVANNVLAHIDNLHDVASALDVLLAPDGVFIAEFPYLADLVDMTEYDTIYHEHLSYFALGPLTRLFGEHGLEPFDVQRLRMHGGSLRLFVGRRGRHLVSDQITSLQEAEVEGGLTRRGSLLKLAANVARSRDALRSMIQGIHSDGGRLAGYGATAKSTTLLTYCEIGAAEIEFIADTTPLKQGLLTPGTHIPIVPEGELMRVRPDYALLLAWNYADAVLSRHKAYLAAGGLFIHPIPLARIIPS